MLDSWLENGGLNSNIHLRNLGGTTYFEKEGKYRIFASTIISPQWVV